MDSFWAKGMAPQAGLAAGEGEGSVEEEVLPSRADLLRSFCDILPVPDTTLIGDGCDEARIDGEGDPVGVGGFFICINLLASKSMISLSESFLLELVIFVLEQISICISLSITQARPPTLTWFQ